MVGRWRIQAALRVPRGPSESTLIFEQLKRLKSLWSSVAAVANKLQTTEVCNKHLTVTPAVA